MRRLWLLVFAAGCSSSDAAVQWKGSVDTLPGGTVRMTNSGEGLRAAGVMRAVPELTLGETEGTGPAVFGSISAVEADDAGRIYVLDRQANELRIFDRAGQHVRSVGRSGAGPLEFTAAHGLVWLQGDSLLISDGRGNRYTVVDREGTLVRTMARPITSFGWMMQGGFANGRLYETGLTRTKPGEPNSSKQVLVGMTLAREAVLTDTLPFPESTAPRIEPYKVENARGGMYMQVPFVPVPVWHLNSDGSLWWGSGHEYRLYHIAANGDTLHEIASQAQPIPVSEQEIATYAEGAGPKQFKERGGNLDLGRIPKQKPFFTDLYVDPDNRIWLDVPTADGLTAFDVFDAQGRLLGRLNTNVKREGYTSFRVRNGKLYLIGKDELDVARVYVLRIEGLDG